MKKSLKVILLIGLLCVAVFALTACQKPAAVGAPNAALTEAPKATDVPAAQNATEAPAATQAAPVAEAPSTNTDPLVNPIMEAWKTSGHANTESEAFRHWDKTDPKEVPVTCAKCHTSEVSRISWVQMDPQPGWLTRLQL